MKKLYAVLVTTFVACIAFAQTAVIKIKVVDEQNLLLPGATVALEDKRYNAVSGNDGTAILYDVPAGKHKLSITYIGYKDYQYEFSSNGNTLELTANLQSGIVLMNNVLVLGDRLKGQAKALNQQKNSDNITNIISADQIGRFPDSDGSEITSILLPEFKGGLFVAMSTDRTFQYYRWQDLAKKAGLKVAKN